VSLPIDITSRNHIDQTLRESADGLTGIIESAMDAIIAVDDAQRIVLFNTAAEKMFRCPANEAMGDSVERFIPQRFRAEHSTHVRRFGEGGVTIRTLGGPGAMWGLRATGEEFPIEASISKVESGNKKFFAAFIRDITERHRAEETVRESEERLRLAQQAAGIGAFEWNIQSGMNAWTAELEAMYGLPPGGFSGTQAAFENLVHPDDRAAVIELAKGVLKTGQPTRGEWRVVWPDGSVHWIAGRWQVFRNESGEPSRVIGVNMDLTEHRQAEQDLRESEQRLRLAVQAGNMYAYEWDVTTDKVARSKECNNILGSSEPSCITRKQLSDRVHPDDRAQFIAAADDLTPENPTNHITYRVIRADGAVIWLEKHGRAIFDPKGRMLRMIGMVSDVTERKRTEDRLREYEKAVEGAEDIIGVVDREYRLLLANRQYLRMRNLTREQVVGCFVSEVLGKEVFETIIKPKLDECFRGRVVRYEMKFSYPTVGERDLLLSYFPIETDNGTIDRVVCISHDITDRKRAEEMVSSMTRKLIEAQEQERARIGRELHDDINQRLGMLALQLERLLDDPSEIHSRARELRKDVVEISSDVQSLSHELHSSSLEYLGVVAGMKSWCKEFAERQRIDVDFRGDVASAVAAEIGLTLFRVLQEALHNVIKHSGAKRAEVRIREDSGEIHLTISDLGRGFEIDATTQRKGLGLTSMRERVRLVNGTITIDSKLRPGTTIHVCVPLPERHAKGKAV
jgi:PAS domain S-box-containing protein